MREITETREIQAISLNILKEIKHVCDENKILYYLDAGTALGAVRHAGFIPWDDDVDICMTRSEFNRFVDVFDNNSKKYYKLLSLETDAKYSLPLPKVIDTRTKLSQTRQNEVSALGIYVDIFVYDNIPDDLDIRKKAFEYQNKLQHQWSLFQYKVTKINGIKSFSRSILQKLLKEFNIQRYYALKLNKYAQTYNKTTTNSIGSMTYVSQREKEIYSLDWFANGVDMKFEDDHFRVPQDFDSFLKIMYGDYMELPPAEQRVSHHNSKIYWIN